MVRFHADAAETSVAVRRLDGGNGLAPLQISTNAVQNLGQENVRVIIAHADNLDKALRIQEMFTDVLPDCETIIGELGPVIGMHGGPGTVGFLISSQS